MDLAENLVKPGLSKTSYIPTASVSAPTFWVDHFAGSAKHRAGANRKRRRLCLANSSPRQNQLSMFLQSCLVHPKLELQESDCDLAYAANFFRIQADPGGT